MHKISGKEINCPCYIDRPLHRYHMGCLVQSQVFSEQQTKEKPILRCDEIKDCPIKEIYQQLQDKTNELKNVTLTMCPNCGEKYLNHTGAELYSSLYEIKELISHFKVEDAQGNYVDAYKILQDSLYKMHQQILNVISEVIK